MKKRFLTMLLALIMVVCVLPMAASAVEYAGPTCESITGEHDWEDGYCAWCALPCKHNFDTNGECTNCDVVCQHERFNATGNCVACGKRCTHESYTNGLCTKCKTPCEHATYKDGACSVCGTKCVHNYVFQNYKEGNEPTCQKTGLSVVKCSICDYTTVQTAPVVACEGKWVSEVAATCTTAGKTGGRSCKYCGKVMTGQQEIPAKGHSYGAEVVVKAPTCTESGTSRFTCTVCGSTKLTYPKAKGHTPVKKYEVAPTCSTVGTTAGQQCSVCKAVLSGMEEIPMIPHTKGSMKAYIKRPTCQEKGSAEYYCTKCDGTLILEINKRVCNVETLAEVPATCNNPGLTAGTKCDSCNNGENCAYCKETLKAQTETPKLGHDIQIKEGSITKEATCDEEGECYYKCTRCGYGYPGTIAKLGHKDVETVIKDATCLKDGVKYVECERCGDYSIKVIPATGHTEEIVPAVAATCTATGLTEGKKCSVCGETLLAQTVTAIIDHEFTVDVEGMDATCTADGYTAHKKCAHCDATEGKEEIDTDGHNFVNYICTVCGTRDGSCEHKNRVMKYTAPTCTDAGSQSFWCPDCNYESMEILPKLDHQKVDKSVAGTCVSKGREHVICTVCNQDLVNRETDFGTHNYVNNQCTYCGAVNPESVCHHTDGVITDTEAPTCTMSGSVTAICGNCGEVVDRQSIPATGHNHVNGICTKCGHKDTNRVTYDYQDVFLTGDAKG